MLSERAARAAPLTLPTTFDCRIIVLVVSGPTEGVALMIGRLHITLVSVRHATSSLKARHGKVLS
jgi:hypothetical protein